MEITTASEGLVAQRKFVEKLKADKFDWGIMVGDAFVRGMRDIGYKSTSFALAELIDNAVQASATRVDLIFGFDGGAARPSRIAVVDDGYGMEPTMVRASLVWGAGTRSDNRSGFGKYGYGLPSASVSQCHRVTVYSKLAGQPWTSAYLDIDEIAAGKWVKRGDSRIEIPAEKEEAPPAFVVDELKKSKRWNSFDHGTIVIWENLDRVDYKNREAIRNDLLTQLGTIYRNYLVATPVTVDGVDVIPCDPLFLTEGFRYYDLDEDRAVALPPLPIEVKDKSGNAQGQMRLRFSLLPATFFRKPDAKHNNKAGKGSLNERLPIADANNGIVFLRNGRQIDVVRPPKNRYLLNATTDRFWGVEVDFDASLDELFSITTSKQQVKPTEKVWDLLVDKANLFKAIGQMRREYQKSAATIAANAETRPGATRASVESIVKAKKFRTTKPPKESEARTEEANENLHRAARKRAQQAGVPAEVIEKDLRERERDSQYRVETEDSPGAPLFRCVQEGGQRVLYLNAGHAFYTELYAGPDSTPRMRAGLEVLLWALGEAEVDADPGTDKRTFYERERASVWSPYVEDALNVLKGITLVETDEDDTSAEEPAA
jgi:hypothetical protein